MSAGRGGVWCFHLLAELEFGELDGGCSSLILAGLSPTSKKRNYLRRASGNAQSYRRLGAVIVIWLLLSQLR